MAVGNCLCIFHEENARVDSILLTPLSRFRKNALYSECNRYPTRNQVSYHHSIHYQNSNFLASSIQENLRQTKNKSAISSKRNQQYSQNFTELHTISQSLYPQTTAYRKCQNTRTVVDTKTVAPQKQQLALSSVTREPARKHPKQLQETVRRAIAQKNRWKCCVKNGRYLGTRTIKQAARSPTDLVPFRSVPRARRRRAGARK